MDYTFGRTIENEKCVPVLDAIDTTFGATCAIWYEEKGRNDAYAVKCLTKFVRKSGFENGIIQCDPENAAKAVAAKASEAIDGWTCSG